MAKLTRVFQKVFGSTAGLGQLGVFGSLAAGSVDTTTDPAEVQSLNNFLSGWFSAILGNNSPAIEDRNGLDFLMFRQLAYLFQQGVSEWDDETEYHADSIVMGTDGLLYYSLVNTNVNQALTDATKWRKVKDRVSIVTKTGAATLAMSEEVILANATSGAFTLTLPAAATSNGKQYSIKKIDTTLNKITIDGDSAETVDFVADIKIGTYLETAVLVCDGTGWYRV